jgi:hypothetical protein
MVRTSFTSTRQINASFLSIPGAAFTERGARPVRDAMIVSAGLELGLGRNAALYAQFDGDIAGMRRQRLCRLGRVAHHLVATLVGAACSQPAAPPVLQRDPEQVEIVVGSRGHARARVELDRIMGLKGKDRVPPTRQLLRRLSLASPSTCVRPPANQVASAEAQIPERKP